MKLPSDLERFIIGLWRFRRAGEERSWCATYSFRGRYYDAGPRATLDKVLSEVRCGLARLRGG